MSRKPRSAGRSRFVGDRSGATAIEFALVLPILVFILVTALQIGALAMISSGLDNAVFDIARLIRTGQDTAPTSAASFRDAVCTQSGGLLPDCANRLTVSVQRFSSFANVAAAAGQAPDGSFDKGGPSDIIMVKANYQFPVIVPFIGQTYAQTGPQQVTIGSRTAFKNEPFG